MWSAPSRTSQLRWSNAPSFRAAGEGVPFALGEVQAGTGRVLGVPHDEKLVGVGLVASRYLVAVQHADLDAVAAVTAIGTLPPPARGPALLRGHATPPSHMGFTFHSP